jgi:predicted metalloenzyme YecM
VAINKSEVFVQVDAFEAAMLQLDRALGITITQSDILRAALNKTGSELAEYLIWEAQKAILTQNAVSDMEDDHVMLGDDA